MKNVMKLAVVMIWDFLDSSVVVASVFKEMEHIVKVK